MRRRYTNLVRNVMGRWAPMRVAALSVVVLSGLLAADSFAQRSREPHRPDFDDGNSDAQSYPFDSSYDADYRRPATDRRNRDRRQLGLRLRASEEGQVFVSAVLRGDPADRAGLRPGDKVLAIDGYEIGSLRDARRALGRHPANEDIELIIAREGRTREIDLPGSTQLFHPVEALAQGAEAASRDIGHAAAEIGGGVRRLSDAWRRDLGTAGGERPRASVLDRYDRFSRVPEGDQADIDDETRDFSGWPDAVIEIDVLPPAQIDDGAVSQPPPAQSGRHRTYRPASPPDRSTRSSKPANRDRSGPEQPKPDAHRPASSQPGSGIEL